MSASAFVAAPAKVNLYLRVLARRPDGYHEIDTLFQGIDLADEVRVTLGGSGVTLVTEGPDLGPPEGNLAYRAARQFMERLRVPGGVEVWLKKRIPVGAGLGGGSSDAAAVLKCLAALTGVPPDDTRIRAAAVELGSDVPFFMMRGALAAGRGRGEILEPRPSLPTAHLVLVSPPVQVATAWAYARLAEARGGDARGYGAEGASPSTSWRGVVEAAHNDFQSVVVARHPEVAASLDALLRAGAELALMSGSGSSSFGLFPDRAAAERAAPRLEGELGWPSRTVRSLSTLPTPYLD